MIEGELTFQLGHELRAARPGQLIVAPAARDPHARQPDRTAGSLARPCAWPNCARVGFARRIGTGNPGQYRDPLQTPAIGWHLGSEPYQKKSCKSAVNQGFSPPSENRGVLGSIPSLAISKDACM